MSAFENLKYSLGETNEIKENSAEYQEASIKALRETLREEKRLEAIERCKDAIEEIRSDAVILIPYLESLSEITDTFRDMKDIGIEARFIGRDLEINGFKITTEEISKIDYDKFTGTYKTHEYFKPTDEIDLRKLENIRHASRPLGNMGELDNMTLEQAEKLAVELEYVSAYMEMGLPQKINAVIEVIHDNQKDPLKEAIGADKVKEAMKEYREFLRWKVPNLSENDELFRKAYETFEQSGTDKDMGLASRLYQMALGDMIEHDIDRMTFKDGIDRNTVKEKAIPLIIQTAGPDYRHADPDEKVKMVACAAQIDEKSITIPGCEGRISDEPELR